MRWKHKQKVLHVLQFRRHSANEEVCVKIEAVRAAWTLTLHVWLVVHTEHRAASIASHHQLMPAALIDLYFAHKRTCS